MAQLSNGISKGVFGAVALSLTFGAVAWGRDLGGLSAPSPLLSADASVVAINRGAKADRAARLPGQSPQTQTLSLRLNGLSDTSVLIRVPVAKQAQDSASPSLLMKSGDKLAEACEPAVSVLTEVAKQLQPGRCVT